MFINLHFFVAWELELLWYTGGRSVLILISFTLFYQYFV